tara:strand:- start:91582 stop:93399 length:1818 start_codon:yes stop_codon:yes gene_type:complete
MSSHLGVIRKLRIPIVALLLASFACVRIASAQAPEDASEVEVEIDVERVLLHATKLTVDIGSRPANSSAANEASLYIQGQLGALGLEVERQEVGTQVMPAIDLGALFQSKAHSFTTSDANLVVHLAPKGRAKDKPILFMAHYDSVPGSPGVVDNAISVGLLLELARVLKANPPARPTILAWTAAEENGLMGARALANEYGEEVGLAVALDLIGSSGDLTLNGLSSLIHERWLLWLAEVSAQAKVDVRAPWTHRAVSRLLPEIERADHGPFTAMGTPAIHLYHRSDAAIYLPYHTRHDTMAEADLDSIRDAAKTISMMCYTRFAMPTEGDSPGVWLPLPGGAKVTSSTAVQVVLVVFLLVAIVGMINLSRAAKAEPRVVVQGRRLGLGSAVLIYVLSWGITGLGLKILLATDHALPWVHAPGRVLAASTLMAAAIGYILAAQAARFGTWVGDARYLMPAIAYTSFVGFFMLAFGLFELAWIVLLPSAAFGAVAGSKKVTGSLIALFLAALPLLGPLNPSFLREMVAHNFWVSSLPLVAYVGLFLMPYALALVFLARRYSIEMPRGRIAMGVCLALVAVSCVLLGSYTAPCTGEQYRLEGLSCEIGR